jgi:hypothetical protein
MTADPTRRAGANKNEKEVDHAVDMTFPASDPTAHGKPTSTEAPCRPVDRKAPKITKEQIEQAQRGEGHKPTECT